MDDGQLRDSFLGSLQKMYDMELTAPLMEFCQGELRVMFYLDSHKSQQVFPSTLSDALLVTRQRITSILNGLRHKGYITMEVSAADRRKMQITLTHDGAAHVLERRQFVEGYFDMLLEALGEENMLEFHRLIQLTAEKMEVLSK